MAAVEIKVGGNLTKLGDHFANIRKQIPYATARALNDTVKQAQKDYRKSLPSIFDRPTPYTLNSAFTRPATKEALKGSVELRSFAAKGTPAARYLGPEILGGQRSMKRFEKALSGLSGGRFIVPGRGAQLDAYGNVSRGQIVQILSRLGVSGDQNVSEKTTRALRRKGLLVKHGHKVLAGDYFVAHSKSNGEPLGIYRLIGRGQVVPVLVFTHRAPVYRARLPFYKIIGDSASENFGRFFYERLRQALATAK